MTGGTFENQVQRPEKPSIANTASSSDRVTNPKSKISAVVAPAPEVRQEFTQFPSTNESSRGGLQDDPVS